MTQLNVVSRSSAGMGQLFANRTIYEVSAEDPRVVSHAGLRDVPAATNVEYMTIIQVIKYNNST
jgi:hypothetical protein